MTFDFNTLRKHQTEFIDFAAGLKHVFCGDDMGLGKTYEGVALDALRRRQGGKGQKTLVVAPLSGVVDSWVKHFQRLTDLKVVRVDTSSKTTRLSLVEKIFDNETDVIVIHWQALQARLGLLSALKTQKWLHVIADEAHSAKNRNAQQTKGLKAIREVDYKTAMTGTPMKNRPDDAWSIIDWLYRSRAEKKAMFGEKHYTLFTSYWNFYDKFLQWIEISGYKTIIGTKNEDLFQKLISPFYLRRTKDLIRDWPKKYYSVREVELSPKQRRPYEDMKRDMIAWLGTQGDRPLAAPAVIAQLTRLQQMALAHCYVEEVKRQVEDETGIWTEVQLKVTALEKPSAKLEALVEIASEMGEQKLVVFSQFSKMIDLAYEELVSKGYNCAKLTGGTKQADRSPMMKEFQDGATQIILCTIGAGGVGIDLYAASTVVFLDRAWSPADNLQAEDRLDRIGQTEPVHVIDIVAKDTVDQPRGRTIKAKAGWIRNMLEGREDAD